MWTHEMNEAFYALLGFLEFCPSLCVCACVCVCMCVFVRVCVFFYLGEAQVPMDSHSLLRVLYTHESPLGHGPPLPPPLQ